MTEIASRLASIRQRLARLEESLVAGQGDEALKGLRAAVEELDEVLREAQHAPSPVQRRRRIPDAEKCPRCAIRSLRLVPEALREAPDGVSEALWRCASCGYETWREEVGTRQP